jgi:hypothetical protein
MEGANEPLAPIDMDDTRTGHTKAESLDCRTSTKELPSGPRCREDIPNVVIVVMEDDDSHRLVTLLFGLLLLLFIDRGGR